MTERIHVFQNGVKVYDRHLTPGQRKRYRRHNVHEPDEERLFVKIIEAIPDDGCYVNVGSAIGYYVILARRLSPGLTIHAVEPLKMHQAYFVENIELNGLSPDKFLVHREGIASSKGYATFLKRDFGSEILHGSSGRMRLASRIASAAKGLAGRLGGKQRKTRRRKTTTIKTITLDQLMETVGRPADLLQMDVQGLEADVLEGGRRSLQAGAVGTFLLGTHGDEVHRQCIDVLSEHGYSIEFEEAHPTSQPDGIIIAGKGVREPSDKRPSGE
ncbi:MAG: FkbM family methyltransferase [Planctomycetes bacterium]|nr:FkbM family methyltransferase [Planctomycetota bacterium]